VSNQNGLPSFAFETLKKARLYPEKKKKIQDGKAFSVGI
jgi:hypothetical protein